MRPAGYARIALLASLQAGVVGTFDALARHAGVPEHQARQTLGNLRREGVVCARRCHVASTVAATPPQRARAVYAPAPPVFDALGFMQQVWR